MADDVKYTDDLRLSLTPMEVARLQAILDSGDRARFYMAYDAMTGNLGALQTARVSS